MPTIIDNINNILLDEINNELKKLIKELEKIV